MIFMSCVFYGLCVFTCGFHSDGVGRTGAFTTIYAQIERIKAEQMADIFQFIKGSRFQRAEIIYNEVTSLTPLLCLVTYTNPILPL